MLAIVGWWGYGEQWIWLNRAASRPASGKDDGAIHMMLGLKLVIRRSIM